MKTIIELFDERPFENVIGTETFRPEYTVYICPPSVAKNKKLHNKLQEYFNHRGIETKCVFVEASVMNTDEVVKALEEIYARYDDCVLDITGGTESALFASGLVCAEKHIPVITYSRKRNAYFNVKNAEFANNVPCKVKMTVEDSFLMAGGSMRKGRVDNGVLDDYMDVIDPFFSVFMKYRRDWTDIVTYVQRISQQPHGETPSLRVSGRTTLKSDKGRRISIDPAVLEDFQKIGMISELKTEEENESFRFKDQQIRTWMRDVGSVLELYVFKKAKETGMYDDVVTSAIVDWEGNYNSDDVTNELDVMATRGVVSFFISCKTCDVKTEALNELALLRDRFGGNMARAAIVTAERGRIPMRHRAEELDIDVIDINDLRTGHLLHRLKALAR